MEGAPPGDATTIVIVGAGIVGAAVSHYLSSSPKLRQKHKTNIIVVDHSINLLMGSMTPQALELTSTDLLKADDVAAALHFATDGTANANAITSFCHYEARKQGVDFREGDVLKVHYDPADSRVTGVQIRSTTLMTAAP